MIIFVQGILTRQDFDFYYHGERCTPDQPQSLTCPLCGELGFSHAYSNESSPSNRSTSNSFDLFQHLQNKHANDHQSHEVLCPICAAMGNGEPNLGTADLISHVANDHQPSQVNTPSSAGEGTSVFARQTLPSREYDFGIGGIRAGFRRGSSRVTNRRAGLGRGTGPVSQHFVVDPSTGLPAVGSGNDPIADLLTQLSTVRRLAAANNNNNSLPPSSNPVNLQTLTRQQYERERYRGIGRLHHHYRGSHHTQQQQQQQSTPGSDSVSSIENDLFDSLFSSTLSIDPWNSSSNNYQTWAQVVSQPPSTSEQQNSSTNKPPPPPTTTTTSDSDPSLLRRMCDESSVPQSTTTIVDASLKKSDFVQNLLLSSFAYSVSEH